MFLAILWWISIITGVILWVSGDTLNAIACFCFNIATGLLLVGMDIVEIKKAVTDNGQNPHR